MRVAGLGLACIAAMAMMPASASAELVCKDFVTADGAAAVLESGAPKKARKAWQRAVTARYGEFWNDWDKAQDKNDQFQCGKAYTYLHRCQARARPCTEVGDTAGGGDVVDDGPSCQSIGSFDQRCDDLIVKVQSVLKDENYLKGMVDGIYGGDTRSALRGYQRRKGLKVTGELNLATLALMKIE